MMEVEAAVRDGRHQVHPEIEIAEHPMRGKALDMKRSLWKDIVKHESRYLTVADTFEQGELLHEDDFILPDTFF